MNWHKQTPQDKKIFSYTRDGRNMYGESRRPSQRAVARRKAQVNRANRRAVDQLLTSQHTTDHDEAEMLDLRLVKVRHKRWRKVPDEALATYVATQAQSRWLQGSTKEWRNSRLQHQAKQRHWRVRERPRWFSPQKWRR